MQVWYCLRYLADVALGRHGWLTPRQISGDVRVIWNG
jgi:hypothetical protein